MALGRSGVVAAYLVRGKESALIDMGYASSAETVLRDLARSNGGAEGIDYLLPTHVHLDHSGACGALAGKLVEASVRVHPKGERHLVDPSKLWLGASELFGDELVKRYGRPQPIDGTRIRPIADGEEINLGSGLTLRAIWTPGHASHHLSYELEGTKTVFTGDAVGLTYSAYPVLIPTTPPTSFNLEAALQSLQRIRELSPKRFLTPHYGVIDEALNSIDANIRALKSWVSSIRDMSASGFTVDAIITNLMKEVSRGKAHANEMPDYLRQSVRVSVLGALRYLESRTQGRAP
jgi:glyoxylase-like metal-dependent hydrolase (beta-lactamase superfamily II)